LSDASCSTPDQSPLLTHSSQLAALCSVRIAAVRDFIFIRAQETLIAKTVLRKLKLSPMALAAPISVAAAPAPLSSVPSSQVADDLSDMTRAFVSPAEQTMQRCQPESSSTCPTDPAANFASPHPLGFAGCTFCGSSAHVCRLCSDNGAPGASAIFYENSFAHKPHLRSDLLFLPRCSLRLPSLPNLLRLLFTFLRPVHHRIHLSPLFRLHLLVSLFCLLSSPLTSVPDSSS
jgi:hypothetical protein